MDIRNDTLEEPPEEEIIENEEEKLELVGILTDYCKSDERSNSPNVKQQLALFRRRSALLPVAMNLLILRSIFEIVFDLFPAKPFYEGLQTVCSMLSTLLSPNIMMIGEKDLAKGIKEWIDNFVATEKIVDNSEDDNCKRVLGIVASAFGLELQKQNAVWSHIQDLRHFRIDVEVSCQSLENSLSFTLLEVNFSQFATLSAFEKEYNIKTELIKKANNLNIRDDEPLDLKIYRISNEEQRLELHVALKKQPIFASSNLIVKIDLRKDAAAKETSDGDFSFSVR